jgi:hypothetical protein
MAPAHVAAALDAAMLAKQRGNRAGARTILRALAARAPDETRAWLLLATVAETRDEQRTCLERVLAIDPENRLALRGLQRFAPAPPPVEAAPPPAQALPRWPLYAVIGAGALVLLLAVLLIRPWESAPPAPSPPRPTSVQAAIGAPTAALPTIALPTPAPATAAPATTPPPSAAAAPPTLEAPAATAAPPAATAIPMAQPTQATLAPGVIETVGPWSATLLRPNFALPLDGSIGPLQPQGRFVLALVAVENRGPGAARIPPGLFALVDSAGNRYQPLPAASTIFLNTYGRAQHGDLSMEEVIGPEVGNVSVPVIFDVPLAAHGLQLRVGDAPLGWPVGQ